MAGELHILTSLIHRMQLSKAVAIVVSVAAHEAPFVEVEKKNETSGRFQSPHTVMCNCVTTTCALHAWKGRMNNENLLHESACYCAFTFATRIRTHRISRAARQCVHFLFLIFTFLNQMVAFIVYSLKLL